MNKFPDDVFQIFLKFNDSKEIFNILCMIEDDKDYRLKKYVYYISNEIKNRAMNKELDKRKKDKVQFDLHISYFMYDTEKHDILTQNYELSNSLFKPTTLDDFYNNDLTHV